MVETSLNSTDYDGIFVVASPDQEIPGELSSVISRQRQFDAAVDQQVTVLPVPSLSAGRVVYSPTGPLDPDYDDVRCFKVAAVKGTKRLIEAGVKRPLVLLLDYPKFEKTQLVTLLGVLEALYTVSSELRNRYLHAIIQVFVRGAAIGVLSHQRRSQMRVQAPMSLAFVCLIV